MGRNGLRFGDARETGRPWGHRWTGVLLALTLAGFWGRDARAWESLDVDAMLRRPGVKLVAVDFYATWCAPCNAAIPRWKKLQEKYWDQGLRLIVVSVQSGGQCVNPGWVPDQVVCDDESLLQERWKAKPLPQAFLWSWQGHLLASHAHVEQVEAAVERYFGETPRILVDDPRDGRRRKLPDAAALRSQVVAELSRSAKFDLVASPAELRQVHQQLREGHREIYSEGCKVPIGEAVPANSLLMIVRTRPKARQGRSWLGLNLRSIRTGCLLASARVPIGKDPGLAVAGGVDKLLRGLAARAAIPGAAPAAPRPPGGSWPAGGVAGVPGAPASGPTSPGPAPPSVAGPTDAPALATPPAPAAAVGYLSVTGSPRGARVEVKGPRGFNGGRPLVAPLPLLPPQEVPAGDYEVTVSAEDHEPSTQKKSIAALGTWALEVSLPSSRATLALSGEPAGAATWVGCGPGFGERPRNVSEEPFGLPARPFELNVPRGRCQVRVEREGWDRHTEEVSLDPGERKALTVRLVPSTATLVLSGEPAGAPTKVRCGPDLQQKPTNVAQEPFGLPAAPLELLVPKGTCRVTASFAGWQEFSEDVSLSAGERRELRVKLERADVVGAARKGAHGIEWVRLPGGRFQMGSNGGESNEKPVHEVRVGAFSLMKSEITVAMYKACVAAGRCSAPNTEEWCTWDKQGQEDHPVNCIDWEQTRGFCAWAGGRLPSEAEWEYAASGGEGRKFPWGGKEPGPTSGALGNFADVTAKRKFSRWTIVDGYDDGFVGTAPVCRFPAGNSKHGICDLAGNVWEWVEDRWHGDYTGAPQDGTAWTQGSGSLRVRRGGSWSSPAAVLRAALRHGSGPGGRDVILGGRCARSE